MAGTMPCPACGAEVSTDSNFCAGCGVALGSVCASCGSSGVPGDKFCAECGNPLETPAPTAADDAAEILPSRAPETLGELPTPAPSSAPSPDPDDLEGYRRHATVLFADTVGSTRLAEELGEETVYRLLNRILKVMIDPVYAEEGVVPEMSGDGVMALFGAPVAHEDSPLRACRAALDIQRRMAEDADAFEADFGVRPKIRVGIHTGPVVVGEVGGGERVEYTAQGDTVHLAARLQTLAEPGGIVISEATQALVGGYVKSEPAGEHHVKGKTEPQRIHRLDGLKSGVTRFHVSVERGLTDLVGRRRELEALADAWEEARNGAMRMVDLVGEAGIGKSRLAHEFRARLGDDAFVLEGYCTADSRATPLKPFIEVVRTSFRLGRRADAGEATRKLTRGMELLGQHPGDLLPYMLNLLGHEAPAGSLDGVADEVVGIRTRDAILELLKERSRLTPTVLFLEDLHWMDRGSAELMTRFIEAEAGLPLLIVSTYRPEFVAAWAGQANVTEMRLNPLSEHSTADLVMARLGTDALPDGLTRLIADKAEGNPLFAEEITHYLIDKGALRQDEDGVAADAGEAEPGLAVTLENLLMDRFDRLDEGPRAVLEVAAVIGPTFATELVGQVAGLNGEAAAFLRNLQDEELIFPDAEGFRFKHALVQDAIYASLLSAKCETLHEKVAEAIEHANGGRAGEMADVLAHHYGQTSRAEKAVHYMALAGEKALGVYSLDEAELRFRQVLELIDNVPGCADDALLADVLLNVSRVYYFQFQFTSIIELVDRYLPRVEALGDKRRLSRFLFETGYAHVFGARVEEGGTLLERALVLGRELGDDVAVAYAELGLMWALVYWGEPGAERRRTLEEMGDRVAATGRSVGDIWLASKAILALSIDDMVWGRPGDSRRNALRLMELGRETNDPRPRAMALWELAYLNAYTGEFEEAVQNAEESERLALSPVDRASAIHAKAIALPNLGRVEEGLALLRDTRSNLEAGGLFMTALAFWLPLGATMVVAGRMAEGIRLIEDSAERMADWGQTMARAYGDFYLGQVYLAMATSTETPTWAVIRQNLGFLLKTLPFASSKARSHLDAALVEYRRLEMPQFTAATLLALALLHRAKKRTDAATACLEEARPIAAAVEATAIVDQIDAALADN